MRKFSSLYPYKPSFTSRKAGAVKKFIMDIMMKATDDLVDINPVAEDIADDIFDLAMYDIEQNIHKMFSLVDSLPVSMSEKIQMKSVLKNAVSQFNGSKFASSKYSFDNTSSFYKTLPETDYELEEGFFADENESGDEYLYNSNGSLYQGGFGEDEFGSEMMADELYAGRKWKGEPGKKYDKPPALDNTSCYSKGDWKGKGTPGEGTCYRLHNDYGDADSGKPGSKERAEYNRKWRQEWSDSKSIKRTKKPGNNWK